MKLNQSIRKGSLWKANAIIVIRYLTVCEAKSAMNDMVAKMGCPDAIDIRCSVLNIHCSDIIAFFLL